MKMRRWGFLLVATLAGAAVNPAWAQLGPAGGATQGSGSIPDFSGIWAHPSLGFESPVSGPGPVRNK